MKWKDQSWYTYVGHWSADISLTWPDWHAIDFFFLHMLHMPGRCRSVCLHLQAKRFRMIFSMAAMWFWHHSITKSKYTSRANQVKCIYCMLTVFFSTKKHTMQFFVHCASTRYSRSNLQLIVYLNHIYIYISTAFPHLLTVLCLWQPRTWRGTSLLPVLPSFIDRIFTEETQGSIQAQETPGFWFRFREKESKHRGSQGNLLSGSWKLYIIP